MQSSLCGGSRYPQNDEAGILFILLVSHYGAKERSGTSEITKDSHTERRLQSTNLKTDVPFIFVNSTTIQTNSSPLLNNAKTSKTKSIPGVNDISESENSNGIRRAKQIEASDRKLNG